MWPGGSEHSVLCFLKYLFDTKQKLSKPNKKTHTVQESPSVEKDFYAEKQVFWTVQDVTEFNLQEKALHKHTAEKLPHATKPKF